MSKKPSKEIVKINETININRYSNGYMVEFSGQDATGDYHTQKVICTDEPGVLNLLGALFNLELAE